MGHRIGWFAGAVLVPLALAGCTTGGTASPAPGTSDPATAAVTATLPPTVEPLPTTTAAPATPAPATPAPVTAVPAVPEALAFFRAQEAPCQQFAQQVGSSAVEPDRFSGAKVVRDLGKGATQIVDGRGTRLVVVAKRGIVLPESGRTDAPMPPPYEFSCSEKIFVGAAHD